MPFYTPAISQRLTGVLSNMRILIAHNDYGSFSGEEAAVEGIAAVLSTHGHDVSWLRRTSAHIGSSGLNKARAFFSGIYSPAARRDIEGILDAQEFDIVQVQNLYPFLSPSILSACRQRGVPVVMRCPNYRIFCPSGLHLRRGQVCEACLGGLKELNCVIHNCESDLPKSFGYAIRNAYARSTGMIRDNVSIFVVLSEFQKLRFVAGGLPEERIAVLHNVSRPRSTRAAANNAGEYVAFAGRLSAEKGITDLLEAARRLPNVPFRIAGRSEALPGIREKLSPNVRLVGFLSGAELDEFVAGCRIFVSPSRWFEGFPNSIALAMAHARPVIAGGIGAVPEIVDEGQTGLLAEPGNAVDLSNKIRYLWQRPGLCKDMGLQGEKKAGRLYSEEAVYRRLIEIYKRAILTLRDGPDTPVAAGSPTTHEKDA